MRKEAIYGIGFSIIVTIQAIRLLRKTYIASKVRMDEP